MKTVLPSYLHILRFCALYTWEHAVSLLFLSERIFCPKAALLHAQSSILYPLTCCTPHPLCPLCCDKLLEMLWRFSSSAPPHDTLSSIFPHSSSVMSGRHHRGLSLHCYLEANTIRGKIHWARLISRRIRTFFPLILYSSMSPFISSIILLTQRWHHCCLPAVAHNKGTT